MEEQEKRIEVSYYWYDHLIRTTKDGKELIEKIEKAIDEKDFEGFMRIKKFLDDLYKDEEICFLPDTALRYIYSEDGDSYEIEELDIAKKENFVLITHHEYECG